MLNDDRIPDADWCCQYSAVLKQYNILDINFCQITLENVEFFNSKIQPSFSIHLWPFEMVTITFIFCFQFFWSAWLAATPFPKIWRDGGIEKYLSFATQLRIIYFVIFFNHDFLVIYKDCHENLFKELKSLMVEPTKEMVVLTAECCLRPAVDSTAERYCMNCICSMHARSTVKKTMFQWTWKDTVTDPICRRLCYLYIQVMQWTVLLNV